MIIVWIMINTPPDVGYYLFIIFILALHWIMTMDHVDMYLVMITLYCTSVCRFVPSRLVSTCDCDVLHVRSFDWLEALDLTYFALDFPLS